MNTKTKNVIRIVVLVALFAWPALETFRYLAAKQQLAASLQQQKSVQLALARLKGVQVASDKTPTAKP